MDRGWGEGEVRGRTVLRVRRGCEEWARGWSGRRRGGRGCSRVQVHRRGSAYGRVSCAYQSRVQSTSAGTQEEAKTGHSPRSAEASAIRGKTTPRRTREPVRVWLRWVAGALSGGARKGGSTRLGRASGRRDRGCDRDREEEDKREGKGAREREREGSRGEGGRSGEHVSRG